MTDYNGTLFVGPTTVVLDSNGYGLVRVAPAAEDWMIISTKCKATKYGPTGIALAVVNEAVFGLYSPYVGDQYYLDGTYSGSSGDTTRVPIELPDGTPLFAQWTGGDPGAIATLNITGKRTVSGGFRV